MMPPPRYQADAPGTATSEALMSPPAEDSATAMLCPRCLSRMPISAASAPSSSMADVTARKPGGNPPVTTRAQHATHLNPVGGSDMLAVLYGTAVYLLFLASFIYAIGFVGNLVPQSLDAPATMAPLEAALINLALLGAFAVQHSLMARKSFKLWWTRF